MRTLLVGLGGLFLILSAALGAARAEDAFPLRVGRVSLADTGAGWRPNGGEWAAAAVNLPVATGTALRTGDKGKAEIRVGDAVLGLAGGTEADIAELDPHVVKIGLPHGRIAVVIRTLEDGDSAEIDLPNAVVRLLQPGHYDIVAGAETGPARIAVFDGRAAVSAGGNTAAVAAGKFVRLDGKPQSAAAPDAFDTAFEARAAADDMVADRLHLSPELAGLAELDRAGDWRAVPDYGVAWFPAATPDGWAPYRDGSWRWISPWGWTWIDNASWGFAPSHYGRWLRVEDHWAWVPGKAMPEPAYVPAVVAFLGTPGVGLSYADAFGPAVAWFPLAPNEVYWPGSSRDIELIRRLNEPDVADFSAIRLADNGGPPPAIVTAEYRNRRFATAVPRSVFLAGRSVAAAVLPIPERRLEWAPLILAGQFPPAPSPVAVAAAPPQANPGPAPDQAVAPHHAVVIAAARAAVPVLAAAHSRARLALHRAEPVRLAVRHAVERAHEAHPSARLRVVAAATRTHPPRRHVAALHGRLR